MALDNPRRQKIRLLATQNAASRLRIPPRLPLQTVTTEKLDASLPGLPTHQGAALEVAPLPEGDLTTALNSNQLLLMLDQVTDPQNIGAILRSAAAFNVAAIILQDKHSPRESATMAKIAAGGLERVPLIYVTNLSRTLQEARQNGYTAIGLDGSAQKILKECRAPVKTLLVMGAEGSGIRRLVAENCDMLAKLPISPQMESLNVSAATAIALYELSGNS